MKTVRRGRWTLQLYWPEFFAGGYASYGFKLDTRLMFQKSPVWLAAGFAIFGLGFGVGYDRATAHGGSNG